MSRPGSRRPRTAAGALSCLLLAISGPAIGKTTTYIDLGAGLGYSTNPLLRLDGQSSAFGRVSAYGVHSWGSERGSTTLTGYIENTSYLHDYGSKQIFSLGAETRQSVSPTVTVFGNLAFSGDFAGQLSNRLISVPPGPVVPDPSNPLPPVTTSPDVFGFSGRQYRLTGSAGASIRSGATGTISLSAGAQRSWFTGGSNNDADFNSYFATLGYSRQVSERTSAGGSVSVQRQDFENGGWANIVNPVLTLRTQLSESLSANASIGILALEQRSDGHSDHSITPSFSGALCSDGQISRWCAHVSRNVQSSLSARVANGSGAAAVTTLMGLDYYRRLSEDGTLQASLSGTRNASSGNLGEDFRTTYLSAIVGYDRKVGHRLYAGVSGGTRKLFQSGPDPDLDFNLSLYLRYRLGDLL